MTIWALHANSPRILSSNNMLIYLLKSKIHGATVTEANIAYLGSLTVDESLMKAADMLEHERVVIWNLTNGNRIETYAISGPAGSGVICANGAAAHHIKKGDKVIIATFASYSEAELKGHSPIKIFVDEGNRIKS